MSAVAPTTAPHHTETERTISLCESLGIAVFAQRLKAKGSWVKGWTKMPVAEAIALTRTKAKRRAINLAGRTGNSIAVIDLDAKNGCDPEDMLAMLLPRLGHAVIMIIKTGRGYHIWLAVSASVGNGFCSAIGGEVFSEAHLAMLPPSVHPTGHVYVWVREPQQPRGRVDLALLGIVPDEPTFEAGKKSPRTPAAQEVQDEFAALMAEKGIARRRCVQDLLPCAWHDDRHPSLSINWETALFHCFGESCGVEGGVGALRRLLGRHTPTYRQEEPWLLSAVNLGCVEEEAERLAEALGRMGLADKARTVRDCKKRFLVGRCTGCGISPAFPLACKHPLCPRCMPGRLAADWVEHKQDLPSSLTFLRLRPRDFWGTNTGVLRKVRNRFNEWRERSCIEAGIYGLRLEPVSGAAILLAIPAGAAVPEPSRAFDVEVVAEDQPPEAFLCWLQAEYIEEARSWETDEDLVRLLEETRRRRRFQGFGGAYGGETTEPVKATADQGSDSALARVPLSKISGGSHSGGGKRDVRLCPFCGAKVEMLDFSVPIEEVRAVNGSYQWLSPPGRETAA